MKLEEAIKKTKAEWGSNPKLKQDRDEVIAKYGEVFKLENIDSLTQEKFQGFLRLKNNKHWSKLDRPGGSLVKDMSKLKSALKILLDESIPFTDRIKRVRDKGSNDYTPFLANAIYTPILLVTNPQKYPIVNLPVAEALNELGLYSIKKWKSSEEEWDSVPQMQEIIQDVATKNGLDLWQMDWVWWKIARDQGQIKENLGTESSLLKFLKSEWTTWTNYQPIIIKKLLENGSEKNYSATVEEMEEKIKLLNFDRKGFSLANYRSSAFPALKKYVKTEQKIILLDSNSFTSDDIPKCLEFCNKMIARWHVTKTMTDENNIYFIQAGGKNRWLEEFEKSKTVGVGYGEIAKFDLTGMSKEELENKTNGKYGTELYNISQIKIGDIIAVTAGSKKGIENFGIVTDKYYFDSNSQTYPHRVNVEYLNFGTTEINSNSRKGIIKSDTEEVKIKQFLIGKTSMAAIKAHSCFILTQNSDSKYDDVEGKQHQYDTHVKHSRELLDGSKFIIQSKINNENYFVGYGKIGKIEESPDTSDKGKPITKFVAKFSEYEKFEPPKLRTREIFENMKSMKAYGNMTPSIFPITRQLYKKITGEDLGEEKEMEEEMDEKYSEIMKILNWKKNVILYGPPGTGKTYHCIEIIKELTKNNKSKISICYPTDQGIEKIQQFKKIIVEKKKLLWGVGWGTPQITKSDYPVKGYIYFQGEIIAVANIVNITEHLDTDKKDLELKPQGFGYDQDYKYYLHIDDLEIYPKSFAHKKLQMYDKNKTMPDIVQQRVYVNELEQFHKFVTFHPSYSYEDFVEGIRPETINGNIRYDLKEGIFKKICDAARKDAVNNPDNKHLLIIDEVNRGNIAKIFGELITLIEADKRNKLSLNLAYSQNKFTVPENLYIIGTMNTADKSLIEMDTALRRRFAFKELMPDLNRVNNTIDSISLKKLLEKLNKKIRKKNLRDKQIGHSYFMDISDMNKLKQVFRFEIIPLLQEYFYEDYNELGEILGKIISKEKMSVNEELIDDTEEFKKELLKIINEESESTEESKPESSE